MLLYQDELHDKVIFSFQDILMNRLRYFNNDNVIYYRVQDHSELKQYRDDCQWKAIKTFREIETNILRHFMNHQATYNTFQYY